MARCLTQATPQAFIKRIEALRDEVRANAKLRDRILHKYAIKNVTGLNILPFVQLDDPFDIIAHLMVGSEGTLAFLAEVVMGTEIDEPCKASAMLYFQDIKEACQAVVAMKKLVNANGEWIVKSAELLDKKSLASVNDPTGDDLTAILTETKAATTEAPTTEETASQEELDKAAADHVAELIDDIYVQTRNENTDQQCLDAKAAWDALTDAQKELVEGEEASPEYFGLDTGDASKDNPRNQDDIGEKELLVVSFGTSFNDSRTEDIKGIEDALAEAFPDWAVRRAFTAQIIINHVQARDGEKIDNMEQAMERAVANGVKELLVQPTHLMHGAEYDEMMETLEAYKDKFESIKVAEPMLGEVGSDATVINADKEAVAKAVVEAALAEAGFESTDKAAEAGTAFVFMGHGTAHVAKVTYSQMQTQMEKLGYKNVFIGTVEGEPEETACENVIEAVKAAGYTNVVLRPLMVVAGDHANNDMAGSDDDSWKTMFEAADLNVTCQISGLGRIPAVQQLYVAHCKDALK